MTIWDDIENHYLASRNTPGDLNEHMPTLRHYAEQCSVITEMGVRDVCSTWAFLAARPSELNCYDIVRTHNVDELERLASSVCNFKFFHADVLKVTISPADLLFIDTKHTYTQLKGELSLHAGAINKYIIMHDTTLYGQTGEEGERGLLPALDEFIAAHPEWKRDQVFENNNGLTIIARH